MDAGFANQPGFLGPYKGEKYYKRHFSTVCHFQGPRELFNRRHSQIRNVVERTFGVLKKRFPILSGPMPPYRIPRQCSILVACCVVNNFIRDHDIHDACFLTEHAEGVACDTEGSGEVTSNSSVPHQSIFNTNEVESWKNWRDMTAADLWVVQGSKYS